ncbi:MAG: YceI family protein [Desulfuromonadales bacterium]|jgi:polyisoprenoid-binding protein YceI
MKQLAFTLAVLATFLAPSFVLAANWKVDPDHSAAHFKVRHMMIADVRGTFPEVVGTVIIDDEDIAKSSVNVTLPVTGITTGVTKRDDHLRSPDFFDVGKHPTMNFTSKQVTKGQGGALKVLGDLTLHGVTKPVELLVSGPSADAKDPWGNIRRGAQATTTLNRKDFGIVYNAPLDNGGMLIGDQVEIVIDLEMIRQGS